MTTPNEEIFARGHGRFSPVNMRKIVTVSTAHITESDGALLRESSQITRLGEVCSYITVPRNRASWICEMDTYRELGFSEDFIRVLYIAHATSYDAVVFDPDATPEPFLKKHDW